MNQEVGKDGKSPEETQDKSEVPILEALGKPSTPPLGTSPTIGWSKLGLLGRLTLGKEGPTRVVGGAAVVNRRRWARRLPLK